MSLLELLTAIREPYVRRLSQAVLKGQVHVEPALRGVDGELVVEGTLALPLRVDYIPRDGGGKSATVDSDARLDFEPISIQYGVCKVVFSPFMWDWVRVGIRGLSAHEVAVVAKSWFLHWFDLEDMNELSSEGLYGVVHYMGEPRDGDECVQLTLDLGSAPAQAMDDLLSRLSQKGAGAVEVE